MNDRRSVTGLALGVWLLFSSVQAVALWQEGLPFAVALISAGTYHGFLFMVAVPLWRIIDGLAWRRLSSGASALAHAAVVTAGFVVWQGAYHAFFYTSSGPEAFQAALLSGGMWLLLQSLITYTMVVTGILSLQSFFRLETQRRRASELRALAQQAELRALRAQLRPHFLFNVLNSIYALIPTDPDNAMVMVERVADLMRDTMDVTDQKLIPLADELALVDRYLDIEALRIGDRLQTERRVTPDVSGWPVPPLILQPLIENAIKHGVAPSTAKSRISLGASEVDGDLVVVIVNDRPDVDASNGEGGKGLWITRNRLEMTYGGRGRLECSTREQRFEVKVTVPPDA